LHETYASALYLAQLWEPARQQLSIAARLGAPAWRVAYSLGLIAEAQHLFSQAKVHYEESLRARPGWNLPEARLRALVAEEKVPQ
jgi:hypothetical protein